MIKSFEIKNFRCFTQTKGSGLTKINLFGGKNNAGKTALLEAIFLMGVPSNQSIAKLLSFRRVSKKFILEMPQKTWDNFFYHQDKSNIISFNFALENNLNNKVIISCDEKIDDFVNMVTNNKEQEDTDEDIVEFANSLTNTNTSKSALHITAYSGDKQLQTNVFVSSSNGIAGRGIAHQFINTNFIPASFKLDSDELATEFDKSKLEGDSEALLKAFKLIDSSIQEVQTLKIGIAEIYLKRANENYMPLSLFGDAMNRIGNFILKIVNNKNSILLIDEIENGIHYENQEKIWKALFELCNHYNVQLFATSHSYEMIKAYKSVIINNDYQSDGSYFEMMPSPVNPTKINIQKIPVYSLDEKLSSNMPIRGEVTKRESS